MGEATVVGAYTVDVHTSGLAGWRCHVEPCDLPYAGPYGGEASARDQAGWHQQKAHGPTSQPTRSANGGIGE